MATATGIGQKTRVEGRVTLTVEEATRELGIGRGLAYEAARRGELPTIRVGRRLLVPVDALDRLLAGEGTAARAVRETGDGNAS